MFSKIISDDFLGDPVDNIEDKLTDEMNKKLKTQRRMPKALVNESFLEQWRQRNKELKVGLYAVNH